MTTIFFRAGAIVLALTFLFLATNHILAQTSTLQQHSVVAGSHDFTPGHGLELTKTTENEFFELRFRIEKDAWFDPSAKGPIQRDGLDWNKLGGVSYLNYFQLSSWPKNVRAALIGWRPHPSGSFEWSLYVNRADGSFVFSEAQLVRPGDQVDVRVDIGKSVIEAKPLNASKTFMPLRIEASILGSARVNVGPWFGGNRPAPQDMDLWTLLRVAGANG